MSSVRKLICEVSDPLCQASARIIHVAVTEKGTRKKNSIYVKQKTNNIPNNYGQKNRQTPPPINTKLGCKNSS